MTTEEIKTKIEASLSKLYIKDKILIDNKTNERAICAHLLCYLKNEFLQWDVDTDYNREQGDVKRNIDRNIIVPDIIIHRRDSRENLVAIEAKGHWNDESRENDYVKLHGLLFKQKYKYAFMIEFEAQSWEINEVIL